jgi:Flp pilus assembly protein TadG
MAHKILVLERRSERGQTIILVAISILSLLAMAALAVDVVTLYVAKGQIQHAADAAALAGAKAFVDSGLTSSNSPSANLLATSMANAYVNATLPNNLVAGTAPTLVTSLVQISNNGGNGNPYITVTLTQTTLPTFFARIWGVRFASVSATATAEAYNPSNWQTTTNVSVAPMCVKPLLVSNNDPNHPGTPFVDLSTGAVEANNVLGEPITLTSGCTPPVGPCSAPYTPAAGKYFPAQVSGATSFCPNPTSSSSCKPFAGYQQSVQCCDSTVYACGGGIPNATVDTTTSGIPTATQEGLQCAIHVSSPGPLQGQDAIDVSNFISSAGPMQITPATEPSGVPAGSFVNTSNSIMTFPIFDAPIVGSNVTVIGFLQMFVRQSGAPADFDGYIVNVVGCSNSNPSVSISGGGVSPVPVRLITPP